MKRNVAAAQVFIFAASALLLAGCGGGSQDSGADNPPPPPEPTAQAAGVIRISVDGLGTGHPTATAENLGGESGAMAGAQQSRALATAGGVHSNALTPQPCSVQIQSAPIDSATFSTTTAQYTSFTFLVRNAQGYSSTSCTSGTPNGAVNNVTLVGLVEKGKAIEGTPFISLLTYAGTKPPIGTAGTITPAHGMQFDALSGQPVVAPGQESLQVFNESEIAGIPLDPQIPAGSYLVPYGFVVRNVNPALGRQLQGNPGSGEYDGQVTFAVKLPLPTNPKLAVYSFKYDVQVMYDDNTRVTQSLEEQNTAGDGAARRRAAALSAFDLAVLGNQHVTQANFVNPICSVRTAGPSSAPTSWLVQAGAQDADLAGAPYNHTLTPFDDIGAGFCSPMVYSSALYSQFVVNGSQSGLFTASGAHGGGYGLYNNDLYFYPYTGYFRNETVSFTLTSQLTGANGGHPAPFVGSFLVGGTLASAGEFRPNTSTATATKPTAVAVADFDGDGIKDLAVVNTSSNTVSVFYGNGDGTYGTPRSFGTGVGPNAIVAIDLNHDGKIDLAVTNGTANSVSILLNQGNRSFANAAGSPTKTSVGTTPVAIAAGDFNHDGNIDLALANHGSNNLSVLFGNGSGAFGGGFIAASGVTGPSGIGVGDFNRDGNLDVVAANDGSNTVYIAIGNGTGGFTIGSANIASSGVGTGPGALVVADVNKDNKLDVVVANKGSNNVSVLFGDGTGKLSGGTLAANGATAPTGVAVGDLDGDGKLDIFVSNSTSNNVYVGYGNGTGGYTVFNTYPVGSVPAGVAIADLDGDGAMDTVTLNSSSNTFSVLLGNNTRTLGPPSPEIALRTTTTGASPVDVVAADFNGDGRLDVAVANAGGNSVTVLLGGAGGVFTAATGSPFAVGTTPYKIVAADFDGDGILDLATVNKGSLNVSFLRGNGAGGFSAIATVPVGSNPLSAAVGDFNGDGRLDLAVTNNGSNSLTVLSNNGGFVFGVSTSASNLVAPYGVAAADFNGDGKLDLAVANASGGDVQILLGNGAGFFNVGPTIAAGAAPNGLTVGDFNQDGVIDVAVGNYLENTVSVALGNGDGTFATPRKYSAGNHPYALAVGDVNGDGYPDLVVANYDSDSFSVLMSTASGELVPAVHPTHSVRLSPAGIALADFLGSGKLSVLTTSYSQNLVTLSPQP